MKVLDEQLDQIARILAFRADYLVLDVEDVVVDYVYVAPDLKHLLPRCQELLILHSLRLQVLNF